MQAGGDGSLLFGTQWDLTLGYLVNRGGVSKNSATSNSTNWGNYYNKELTVTASTTNSGWPKGLSGTTYNWGAFTGTKSSGTVKLLSTGAVEDVTNKLNIVDLAGNCFEWTMEAYSAGSRAGRGRPCTVLAVQIIQLLTAATAIPMIATATVPHAPHFM